MVDLHELLQSQCINSFFPGIHCFWLISIKGVDSARSWKQYLGSGELLNSFFAHLDEFLHQSRHTTTVLSLDPYIWADAIFDTRNPRGMDYGKNKNLYYCYKSNQKEHRAVYQMTLVSPGTQGKYTSRCIPSILSPALLWRDIQQPDSSTCLVAQLCLAPCCEKGVLWIAQVLSDTRALLDSYRLPTVCYHYRSWKSSPGKMKQQLHSIRMMLVG